MSKKDFSVALKYVEARPRSQRRKGTEARVSGISVVGSGASATDLSLLQANLISVTNNFTALKDLFDSMFEKDSDGNIHAKLSLWSSGGITAGSAGSGGSGGGGGTSYNRLDSWVDYSADKAGYVLSAALGKDLDNRVSALANAGYITASYLAPYALRSEIPSLDGYATHSWVSDNYLSKAGGTMTGSLCVSMYGWNNQLVLNGVDSNAGIEFRYSNTYVAALSCAQSNPYWFIGETAYPILHSGNYADYITNSYIKSTLGISDWALASVKPTYTASEVGALAQDSSGANADLDTILDSRTAVLKPFFQAITGTNIGSARKGVLRMSYNGSESQLLFDHYNRILRYRTIGDNLKDWATIAFTSDIPTKLSQLTDDVVAGKYLPLSGGTLSNALWRSQLTIERSGSANDSAIAFTNSNGLLGCLGYRGADAIPCVWLGGTYTGIPIIHANNIGSYNAGSANILQTPSNKYYMTANTRDDDWKVALKIGGWDSQDAGFATKYGTAVDIAGFNTWYHRLGFNTDGKIEHWKGINTTEMSRVGYLAYTTSNVASATKLQTPRTIWGQSFDGTGNINGAIDVSSVTTSLNTPVIKFASNCYLDMYGNYVLGKSAGSFSVFNESYLNAILHVLKDGNVAIGARTADAKLHVHGNGKFTGALTANSFIGNLTGNAGSANRLKFVQITSAYGDLNTLLCGGGLLYNFSSPSYWVNAPADVLYGAAIQFQATKAQDSHSLSGQLLWDVINGSNVDCTRTLWWRAADANGFANSKWHQIAFADSNVASATKLETPRTIWGQSFDGTGDITGALTSQALRSAGISIGCDASGVASDNYTREINTFANKLYLQYRGGDLDLCGGGGTTYIGGALDGKTANFTSLTSPAITTNSLTIGGVTLTYDSGNEALCINGNMYALRGVTAGGAGISTYSSLEARVARLEQQLNI